MGRVFKFRSGGMQHNMHLLPGVAKQPNIELKTRPKQLLGSLPLVIALPGPSQVQLHLNQTCRVAQLGACTVKLFTVVI